MTIMKSHFSRFIMMIINKVRTKFFDVIEITSIRFIKPAIVISIEPQNPSTTFIRTAESDEVVHECRIATERKYFK